MSAYLAMLGQGVRWLRRRFGWPEVSQRIEQAVAPTAGESGPEPVEDQGVGEGVARGVLPEAPEPVDGAEDRVPDRATSQDGQPQPSAPYVFTKHDRCTTCYRPDADDIHAAYLNGQSVRAVSRERHIPFQSLRRHLRHVGLLSSGKEIDSNTAQTPHGGSWGLNGSGKPPEGTDPLLWELSQLRQIAQGALDYAGKTRNLPATASLLRAANGLLDLLARVEKRVGSDAPTVQVAIAANPEWLSLQAKLLAALDRHPAARADVLAALRGDVQTVPALPAHPRRQAEGRA